MLEYRIGAPSQPENGGWRTLPVLKEVEGM